MKVQESGEDAQQDRKAVAVVVVRSGRRRAQGWVVEFELRSCRPVAVAQPAHGVDEAAFWGLGLKCKGY